jgi:heme oxygenase
MMDRTTGRSMGPSPSLCDRLRAETRAAHDAVEALSFSRALLDGTITTRAYVEQLLAWDLVHAALEDGLRRPAFAALWRDDLSKRALLARDLAYLEADLRSGPRRSAAIAARVADEIERLADADAIGLVGWLYVLEGSTLGNAFLRPRLVQALGLHGGGADYLGAYGRDVRAHWLELRGRIDAAIPERHHDEIVAVARRAFAAIGEILAAIEVEPMATAAAE